MVQCFTPTIKAPGAEVEPSQVDALYLAAGAIVEFMNAGPPILLSLVLLLVVGIPVTLVHELGHAVVARLRLGSAVDVVVGSAGKAAEMHLGDVKVRVNAPASPLRAGGSATLSSSRATARDVLLIAAAGPAASAAGALVTGWWFARPAPGLVRDALWVATLAGVLACLNVIPLKIQERLGEAPIRTDGQLILDAARAEQAFR